MPPKMEKIATASVPAPQPQPQTTQAARIWTTLDLINWTKDYFNKKGIESARLEAELLLAAVLDCARIRLYVDFEKSVAPEKLAQFREYVKRRGEKREPLQYILGRTEFIDLRLKITPAVLIPRPETELLALWAAERVKEFAAASPISSGAGAEAKLAGIPVLDLCTGSGCLALYLAAKEPRVHATATDISDTALALASENAKALGLDSRVAFLQGDLFEALPVECKGSFEILVANPPYIDSTTRGSLPPEVRDHEPAAALFADEGGLGILRRIVKTAPDWLRPGGCFGLEFGIGQGDALKELAGQSGAFEQLEILQDSAKLPRMLVGRRKKFQ